MRWAWIKKEFTKAYLAGGGKEQPRSASRVARRDRGIWQRRFWEHAICDAKDLERHVEYIHYNPVKHGLVACPSEYPFSTFHRFVQRGVYQVDWGCAGAGTLVFDDIAASVVE